MDDALELRPWEALGAEQSVEFYLRNRQHLSPWEPLREAGFYSREHHEALRNLLTRGRADGRQYMYAVFAGERLAGRVGLSNLVRGVFQSADLGYLTDEQLCGRGIASRAVKLLLQIGFDELGLHRVQAAVIPRNQPSVRVLEKCGFRRIGLSARYLRINDRWEDHLLYAITLEDVPTVNAGASSG